MHPRDVAILIVNGDTDPVQGRWLDLCLSKLEPSREVRPFHVYVWNNNREDQALRRSLEERHWVSYLEAAPYETLVHPHAVPLQRLYALARREGAKIIVTLDSDAHPLRPDWLQTLVSALEEGAALAGVWRDELHTVIDPYLHPSCLATTVDFIEEHRLRFDLLPARKDGQQSDTMSHFTRAAQAAGRRVVPLKRSNANNFHRLMGGVYGDLIYHHGAGRSFSGTTGQPRCLMSGTTAPVMPPPSGFSMTMTITSPGCRGAGTERPSSSSCGLCKSLCHRKPADRTEAGLRRRGS